MSKSKILVLGSAVGAYGSGATGGVSRFSYNICKSIQKCGYNVEFFAPETNEPEHFPSQDFPVEIREISGTFQPSSGDGISDAHWAAVKCGVLQNMLKTAYSERQKYVLIINLNHDWLPYYISDFFPCPVLHRPNLCVSDAATDAAISHFAQCWPDRIAFISKFQAMRYSCPQSRILPAGLDPLDYTLGKGKHRKLAWGGRIIPAKGLEKAAEIAFEYGETLHVAGEIADQNYWSDLNKKYPGLINYAGYLNKSELQSFIGGSQVFLQTQNWEETLGIITVEAMFCGTPVVAINRGANNELAFDDQTGYILSEKASVKEWCHAIDSASLLDRANCRDFIISRHSIEKLTDHIKSWLQSCLK